MRPQYVTRDEVPEDVVANERRIAEQMTREEGKPEQAIPKIVEGRVNAFVKDIVLVEQASVAGPQEDGQAAAGRAGCHGPRLRAVPDRAGRLRLGRQDGACRQGDAGGSLRT